jgi:transcriptional regulator with XRE-family HTH domain
MDFYRIQDKMISWQKIEKTLQKALTMRVRGFSQQEVADRLQIDRTFISRLEGIGELRKGQSIAFVGFPIANKDEIRELLESEGCDFILIMDEQERQDFINQRTGKQMLDDLMDLTAQVRSYDTVICVGSDQRLKMFEGILDGQVASIIIGSSPITEDKWVDPQQIRKILRSIKDQDKIA